MRRTPNLAVERYRLRTGEMGTSRFDGNNGAFYIPLSTGVKVAVIASDGMGWDHVSVSLDDRCPTWDEMCEVKDLFFTEDECCVEYHPPRSSYRNAFAYCLHIWRPQTVEIPMPDPIMVAPAGLTGLADRSR